MSLDYGERTHGVSLSIVDTHGALPMVERHGALSIVERHSALSMVERHGALSMVERHGGLAKAQILHILQILQIPRYQMKMIE